jgi:predicted nucleic acid-binding protein
VIVADASVVLDLVLGGGSEAGDALAARLRVGEVVCAPHLVDAEVGQGLRRYVLRGELSTNRGAEMVRDFLDLPITRYPHRGLLERAFSFLANVTVYDALYLALAEGLDCSLLTGDRALRVVPGCTAEVEVVATTA